MITVHWFRRDLRLEDNTALQIALKEQYPVLPVFIFDRNILDELPRNDARVNFIYQQLKIIFTKLREKDSTLKIFIGDPLEIWMDLVQKYKVGTVYFNKDYDPYAQQRDQQVTDFLESQGIPVHTYKDQVIFEESEVIKTDGLPYTVFTPYKRKWLENYENINSKLSIDPNWDNLHSCSSSFPSINELGFVESTISVRPYNLSDIAGYAIKRDIPCEDATSHLSPHLRFGTVSIRKVIDLIKSQSDVFMGELIWREFFMQILYHFPKVITENFRAKYDGIRWRNNDLEFDLWCKGQTGYPIVDAGMRQLNSTGYMHNRVRMITAGFLCKHLLIDWRLGEAYFAKKLIDYDISSNNGNWQWAAGTGCDAAPYFRVFNPMTQQMKFDKDFCYVKRWVPEYGTKDYPNPMVDHKFARERALATYKRGIETKHMIN